MSFADRAGLAAEITGSLRCGRAFLREPAEIPVLSDCVLVLVHPDHGGELRVAAQVVMVNDHGTGLALRALGADDLSALDAFAASTAAAEHPAAVGGAEAPPSQVAALPAAPAGAAGPAASAPATAPADGPTAIGASAPAEPLPSPSAALSEAATAERSTAAPAPATTTPPSAANVSNIPQRRAGSAAAEGDDPLDEQAAAADDLAESLDFPRADEQELEYASGGEADLDAPAGGGSSRPRELQTHNRQERLRRLSPAEQLKVARRGELPDRLAVERLYGKQVWEALLQNPRISIPEVAKIARKGTVPKPLIDTILDNAGWIKADAVRRALLSNPKVSPDAVLKLLRATPKHELKLIEKGSAYGASVREAARKLLRQ